MASFHSLSVSGVTVVGNIYRSIGQIREITNVLMQPDDAPDHLSCEQAGSADPEQGTLDDRLLALIDALADGERGDLEALAQKLSDAAELSAAAF